MNDANIWTLRMCGAPARGECEACGRLRLFTADELRTVTGADHDFANLVYLGRRMRCTSCGEKRIKLEVNR